MVEAIKILKRAATVNSTSLPDDLKTVKIQETAKMGIIEILKELMKTKKLLFILGNSDSKLVRAPSTRYKGPLLVNNQT